MTARQLGAARSSLTRAVARGEFERVAAGVYVRQAALFRPETRIEAARAVAGAGVVLGSAALFLTMGLSLGATPVEIATREKAITGSFFRVVRRRVDPDWIVEVGDGIFCAAPAHAAADLAGRDHGTAIDTVLREGGALDDIRAAARTLRRWPGGEERRRVIKASRMRPWSQAERRFHQILWDAGITGWDTNVEVWAEGRRYFLDVALRDRKIAFEVDGYEFHGSRDAFENDRLRRNALTRAGWTIYNLTWLMLEQPEQVAAWVRAAIRPDRAADWPLAA